jgi:hypothetical protein
VVVVDANGETGANLYRQDTMVMRSYFDLTTLSKYHIDQRMAEAEHDRLVGQCGGRAFSQERYGRHRGLVIGLTAACLLSLSVASVLGGSGSADAAAVSAARSTMVFSARLV